MKNDLKDIRVASPCTVSWESMAGDERVRHCTLCSLNVYNFGEMTRDEIREVIVRTEGRLCARMYRRADGTLLTRDCPSAFQVVRQRMSRVAAAMAAALFSVSAFASDGATCEKPLIQKGSNVKFTTPQLATAQQAGLAGVVTERTGTALPGVTVTLRNEATKRELSTLTDIHGAFTFTSPDDGLWRMDVKIDGLKTVIVEHIRLQQNRIARVEVAMQFEALMGEVLSVVPTTGMPDGPSTTFSQELINKLPI